MTIPYTRQASTLPPSNHGRDRTSSCLSFSLPRDNRNTLVPLVLAFSSAFFCRSRHTNQTHSHRSTELEPSNLHLHLIHHLLPLLPFNPNTSSFPPTSLQSRSTPATTQSINPVECRRDLTTQAINPVERRSNHRFPCISRNTQHPRRLLASCGIHTLPTGVKCDYAIRLRCLVWQILQV